MNIELRIKWLLFILNQNREKGFNIYLEILVILVLIILGGLYVLSGFLPDDISGRQAEGKQYVSSINKAQQAYYEENGTFMTENSPAGWERLAVGIKTKTTNYKYLILSSGQNEVSAIAVPLRKNIKGYTGVTALLSPVDNAKKISQVTQAIVCETHNVGDVAILTEVTKTEVKCLHNSSAVK